MKKAPKKVFSWQPLLAIAIASCILFLLCIPQSVVLGFRVFLARHFLHGSYMVVRSQSIGNPFIVDRARLEKSGYIALFIGDFYDSPFTELIGWSNLLPAGAYRSNLPIEVALSGYEAIVREKGLKNVGANRIGHPIFVVVFYDDGDGTFSISSDTVARDVFGSLMVSKVLLF